jgi:cyclophilin family peptidyl-prolyl cis-trans isomerase
VHGAWAPNGADRFHELVTSGYYDDAPVFRIRSGKQDPVFEGGNAYLKAKFPLLDYIRTARIIRE